MALATKVITIPTLGTRERLAAIYPGTRTLGLCLWVVTDGLVEAIGVGTAPKDVGSAWLERFSPDVILVESHRQSSRKPSPVRIPANTSLRFVRSGWEGRKLRIPAGVTDRSPLAANAWRMGVQEVIDRGPYKASSLNVSDLTQEWIDAHSPPRIANGY